MEFLGVSLLAVEKAAEELQRVKKKDSQRNLSFSFSGSVTAVQDFTQHSDRR